MDNKELIGNLERINFIVNSINEKDEYLEHGITQVAYRTLTKIKSELGTLEKVPSAFSNMPTIKENNIDLSSLVPEVENLKKYLMIAGISAAAGFLLYMISHVDIFNVLTTLAIFAVIGIAIFYSKKRKELKENQEKSDAINKHNTEAYEDFHRAMENYEAEFSQGFLSAEDFMKKQINARLDYESLIEFMASESNKTQNEIDELHCELNSFDFVPYEYLHLVPTVITLLKSGRADDYKEALNMAIADEKETEERERRYAEEARRTEIMEQQAEAERKHYREMEAAQAEANRMQEAHNKAVMEAEGKRIAAESAIKKREREDQMRAERDGRQLCFKCRKYSSCHGRNMSGGSCGAFDPR